MKQIKFKSINSSYLSTQWAAVMIHWLSIIDPPQKCCHFHCQSWLVIGGLGWRVGGIGDGWGLGRGADVGIGRIMGGILLGGCDVDGGDHVGNLDMVGIGGGIVGLLAVDHVQCFGVVIIMGGLGDVIIVGNDDFIDDDDVIHGGNDDGKGGNDTAGGGLDVEIEFVGNGWTVVVVVDIVLVVVVDVVKRVGQELVWIGGGRDGGYFGESIWPDCGGGGNTWSGGNVGKGG